METDQTYRRFPGGFLFGAATAAYQIEGSTGEDGRGMSIWDEFCRRAGRISGGDTGDIACDHYRRFREDVAVMGELGLDAYRFSVSWPRIVPDGGFADRRCIEAYLHYVATVVSALGDRVRDWITFNEPWVYSVLGHLLGVHAPGVKNPWKTFRVAHHQLVAHGRAVQAAADLADQSINRFFLDALFRGSYPGPYWRRMSILRPRILPEDMKDIATPIDFLGINNYTRHFARPSWRHPPFFFDIDGGAASEREFTAMGWEVYPDGLFELLLRLKNEYGNPPVYITENGAAYTDFPEPDRSTGGIAG